MRWVMSSGSMPSHLDTAASAASMKSFVASSAKRLLRALVLGLRSRPVCGIEKLGIFGGGVQGQFADRRVPGVDGGGIKARGHEP